MLLPTIFELTEIVDLIYNFDQYVGTVQGVTKGGGKYPWSLPTLCINYLPIVCKFDKHCI